MTAGYDTARIRHVLLDLLRTTRGEAPMVELKGPARDDPVVRGVANRAGALRLGLWLASAALEADSVVSVQPDGTVRGDAEPGLVEIVFTDEKDGQVPSPRKRFPLIGVMSSCLIVIAVLGLAVIGLLTVVGWLDRL